jgi:homocysteine S-methyltransferase
MLNSKRVKVERDLSLEKKGTQKTQIDQRSLSERKESYMGQKLSEGRKVFSIEVLPPKGPDVEKFLQQLQLIDQNNIDFVNVPDGPRASTRISSLHVSSLINRDPQFKLKALPHLTTRDRNLIALQSDLLGAYVNAVYDVLVVTGDPPKLGNNREATSVYDVDAIGLTYMMNCLNKGVSPKGENLGKPTSFGIGVAANPTAVNMELEIQRWKYKCESGADFAVTQPIFDPDAYLHWREKTASDNRPHLIGIWPFISYANAEFLAHEVPGVKVPDSVLQEMEKTKDNKEEAIKRGIEIALQTMQKLENSCEGFCVNAPLGKVEVALELIKLFRK